MSEPMQEGLRTFISRLLLIHPFYGDILLRVPIIRDDSVRTACTNGKSIWWSGKFLDPLSQPQRNYVLMHEVLHMLLLHPLRGGNRDSKIWNIAADIQVNILCDQLARQLNLEAGETLMDRPPEGIFTERSAVHANELTAEDLYGQMKEGTRIGEGFNWKDARSRGSAYPVLCQSRVYGKGIGADLQPPADGMVDRAEMEAAESTVRQMIRDAMSHETRGLGSSMPIPEVLLQLVKKKPLDWRVLLKDFLTDNPSISDETSYATPERKYLHMDLIIPGHCPDEAQELEEVWAFVDSSGSVGQEDLNSFLTELYHILKQFQCRMHIAYWDTSVTDVYRNIRREKEVLNCLPKHSGGTDINCVYRWLEENHIRPGLMLILTDGYFGRPEQRFLIRSRTAKTMLILCNRSENPIYEKIGRVCRLKGVTP